MFIFEIFYFVYKFDKWYFSSQTNNWKSKQTVYLVKLHEQKILTGNEMEDNSFK